MTTEQLLKNLEVPVGQVDVVLDTDTYNEIDDQFAAAYLLKYGEKLKVKGICAAPFFNERSVSPEDGMVRSYQEIFKLLKLADREDLNEVVFEGSRNYLPDETTPVDSPAARFMAELSNEYSPEKPLYIVAIGAITNVASALLLNPRMKENTVIVWLGGTALHCSRNDEFNLLQDIAAARVVFGCGVPLVQLPCWGVVDHFATTEFELRHWLQGKNAMCDYLVNNVLEETSKYAAGKPWSRVIWDVTAVAWLVNDGGRFFESELRHSPIPEYDKRWSFDNHRHFFRYVSAVNRDALMEDLFDRVSRV